MKRTIIFVFAALLACSFAITSCGQSGDTTEVKTSKKDTPSDVMEKVLKLLKNKDYKAAVQYSEGIAEASEDDVNGFIALVQAIYEANGGLAEYEILGEEISEDGQSAKVKVKYTFGNGEANDDTESLILTEKGWMMKM
ncbi:MAG: DUF4878 domain-containing protein [Bacteroidales bacterium]|nr:DUF4878 domain-containing protein [Bacteroidales bacterium]MBR4716042.1 DUF4878 domain-containing protein [Bacteroidales bacterium]